MLAAVGQIYLILWQDLFYCVGKWRKILTRNKLGQHVNMSNLQVLAGAEDGARIVPR